MKEPNTNQAKQVSITRRRADERWQRVNEHMEQKTTVHVQVSGLAKNKEGRPCGVNTTLDGLRAFLPASQVPRNQPLEGLTGKLAVHVIECDQFSDRGGTIVISLKSVIDLQRSESINSLSIGTEIEGTVTSEAPNLGYFICVAPGLDGLLHKSQVGDRRFAIGDKVDVRPVKIDVNNGRVGLVLSESATPTPKAVPRISSSKTSHPAPATRTARPKTHRPVAQAKPQNRGETFGSFSELATWFTARASK